MKKVTFTGTVLATQVIFLLLHIHKYSTITELMYTKQRYEDEITKLEQEEQRFKQELCALQNKKTVSRYAQKYLAMSPVRLQQLRTLEPHAT